MRHDQRGKRVRLEDRAVIEALAGGDGPTARIVMDLRLPRALIAVTAGAMLGLAGAILQSITRNPLASPALTGVLSGAVLAAVLWSVGGPHHLQSGPMLPLVATLGGLATGIAVYVLSWRGGTNPLRLILAGVLIAAVLSSLTSLVG